jgi:ferredoxin-fold anticodon binding domain-containing protein
MDDIDPTTDFPREIYSNRKCHQLYSVYCGLFSSLKIINRFINDILFFVVNFVIDLCLLNRYSKYMNQKANILSASVDAVNENKKQKKRTARMVITVSSLFFVSNFPEFMLSLILMIYSNSMVNIFDFHFSTSLINEEAQVFTLVSISFQLYVLIRFNKNFSAGFKDLLAIK